VVRKYLFYVYFAGAIKGAVVDIHHSRGFYIDITTRSSGAIRKEYGVVDLHIGVLGINSAPDSTSRCLAEIATVSGSVALEGAVVNLHISTQAYLVGSAISSLSINSSISRSIRDETRGMDLHIGTF
jgi:hypothetical protein